MAAARWRRVSAWLVAMAIVCVSGTGCVHRDLRPVAPIDGPRELAKAIHPEYTIEPPDILLIDALYLVPLPPYRIKSLDALLVRVPKAATVDPINGIYQVDPDGTINLGVSYGTVRVAGLTLAEAKTAIEKRLAGTLANPVAEVAIAESRGLQQVRGQHLVRTDGTVSLGTYGSVQVVGLTLAQAKKAIEAHLSAFLQTPEVSVDVAAYNSKVFYVVYDGGGAGQQVYRLPITGNETVLDAVSQLNGLSPVSDTHRMWVARPGPPGHGCQVMPVDWTGITACARTETNYQLFPGDRIYVKADPLVTIDTKLGRMLSPIERILGVTLLGETTVRSFGNGNNGFLP